MQKIPRKLGEILIERQLVTEQQLLAALEIQHVKKLPLGEILIEQGYVPKEKLEAALARQCDSRLGEILINAKLITFDQLIQALDIQRTQKPDLSLGEVLVELGYVTEDDLLQAQAKQYKIERINLVNYEIDPKAFSKIPVDILKRHHVIPIAIAQGELVVATADPEDVLAISDLQFISGTHIRLVLASRHEITSLIE